MAINKHIVVLIMVLLVSCVASVPSGQGYYKYDRYHSSDFPAYIKSIDFAQNKLSGGSPLKWGSWTIKFTNGTTAVAKHGGGGEMIIDGLTAYNEVQGEYPCWMQFCKECAWGDSPDNNKFYRRCKIVIGSTFGATGSPVFYNRIDITCPIDVTFN